METKARYDMGFIWRICLVAALGGFLFGYDWVVIGGAKPFFVQFFHLGGKEAMVGWAMSSALVGCLIGSVLSGMLSDRFGRKRLLILAGLLFVVSAVGTALASAFNVFVVFRLLGGVGIGLASNLSPMYIAEISPAKFRGRLVAVTQLNIVVGILAAFFSNYLIARLELGQIEWRWMFGVEAFPAAAFFLLLFFTPRSPRWLVSQDRADEARGVMGRLGVDASEA